MSENLSVAVQITARNVSCQNFLLTLQFIVMFKTRISLDGGYDRSQGSPLFLQCCINLQHHLAYVNQAQTLVDTESVATWQ
jgi:hypothetical protein